MKVGTIDASLPAIDALALEAFSPAAERHSSGQSSVDGMKPLDPSRARSEIVAPGEPQLLTQPAAHPVIARSELQGLPHQLVIEPGEQQTATQPTGPVGETENPGGIPAEPVVARVDRATEALQSGIRTPADPRRFLPA